MSAILAILADLLVGALMAYWRRHRLPATVPSPRLHANDDEPFADYNRVHDDLRLIDAILADGRIVDARREVARLIDVMNGDDEAALVDCRWREIQRQRSVRG